MLQAVSDASAGAERLPPGLPGAGRRPGSRGGRGGQVLGHQLHPGPDPQHHRSEPRRGPGREPADQCCEARDILGGDGLKVRLRWKRRNSEHYSRTSLFSHFVPTLIKFKLKKQILVNN